MSVKEQTLKSDDIEPYTPPTEGFPTAKKRQYYGGFAWFSNQNSEFMLAVKSDSVKSLEKMR